MKRNFFSLLLLNDSYPTLHGLRFLAIFGVIQNHACLRIIYHEKTYFQLSTFKVLSQNLWFVMDLFFFMSGFLIANILFDYENSNHIHPIKKWFRFYLQRGFRIFPLYYVFIFLYWIIIQFTDKFSDTFYQKNTFLNWREIFFLTNYPFDPKIILSYWSWSLSAEEHFYLLCPIFIYALLKLKKHSHRILLISGVWLSGLIVRWYIVKNYGPSSNTNFITLVSLYTPTHTRYDIFFSGVLLSYIRHFKEDFLLQIYSNKLFRYLSLFLSLGIFALIAHPGINPIPPELDYAGTLESRIFLAKTGALYFGTLTGIAYLFLISWFLYTKNTVTQIFSHTIFRHLASLGYGVYLVHMPILIWMTPILYEKINLGPEHFFTTWLVLTCCTLIISLVISYVLHLLVEKPFLHLRNRVFS